MKIIALIFLAAFVTVTTTLSISPLGDISGKVTAAAEGATRSNLFEVILKLVTDLLQQVLNLLRGLTGGLGGSKDSKNSKDSKAKPSDNDWTVKDVEDVNGDMKLDSNFDGTAVDDVEAPISDVQAAEVNDIN